MASRRPQSRSHSSRARPTNPQTRTRLRRHPDAALRARASAPSGSCQHRQGKWASGAGLVETAGQVRRVAPRARRNCSALQGGYGTAASPRAVLHGYECESRNGHHRWQEVRAGGLQVSHSGTTLRRLPAVSVTADNRRVSAVRCTEPPRAQPRIERLNVHSPVGIGQASLALFRPGAGTLQLLLRCARPPIDHGRHARRRTVSVPPRRLIGSPAGRCRRSYVPFRPLYRGNFRRLCCQIGCQTLSSLGAQCGYPRLHQRRPGKSAIYRGVTFAG